MRLIDRLGFDAVDAGPLENGVALQPDGSPFVVIYNGDELRELISQRSAHLRPRTFGNKEHGGVMQGVGGTRS
jgi:hypothetical protein